jgi:hypothetical protein
MATYTIAPQQVLANVEKDSPAVTLPANVSSVTVQLTDQGGSWAKTAGNLKRWGAQHSSDGGATWSWGPVFQGDPADPSTWVAFGTLSRGGGLPSVAISSTALVGLAGGLLRLAVLADANITLGAVITTA